MFRPHLEYERPWQRGLPLESKCGQRPSGGDVERARQLSGAGSGGAWSGGRSGGTVLLTLAVLAGCSQQMANQPRIEPLEAAPVFDNNMGSRDLVAGTVARGHSRGSIVEHSTHFRTGNLAGARAESLPAEIVDGPDFDLQTFLVRGGERYQVFCSHCHDSTGTGRGIVPQRGYPEPPTFHSRRLRDMPLGELFRIIGEGVGKMPAHRTQIPAGDRWAIAAYVRALQFSRHADVELLPPDVREELNRKGTDAATTRGRQRSISGARPTALDVVRRGSGSTGELRAE